MTDLIRSKLALAFLCSLSVGSLALAADKTSGGAGSKMLHQQMMKSASSMKSMKMTGDIDHDFVMMMKQHHQHGIDMANVELQHGSDAKAKDFAQKTVTEQTKDIAEFDQWLAGHAPAPNASAGTSP